MTVATHPAIRMRIRRLEADLAHAAADLAQARLERDAARRTAGELRTQLDNAWEAANYGADVSRETFTTELRGRTPTVAAFAAGAITGALAAYACTRR